jgi:hypothetical protein
MEQERKPFVEPDVIKHDEKVADVTLNTGSLEADGFPDAAP